MNKNTICKYIGRYFTTMLKIPYMNGQGKPMFYGDDNNTLRLKNVLNDKRLKRYSNSTAARICLKHILDDYFIGVRPKSTLEADYKLATNQSPQSVNQKMIKQDQLKREKVTVRRGNRTETLELPPLPMNHRTHYAKQLKQAQEASEKKSAVIAQLKAELQKQNHPKPDANPDETNNDDATNPSPSDNQETEDHQPDNQNDNQPAETNDEPTNDNTDNPANGANDDENSEEQSDPKRNDGIQGEWK